MCSLGIEPITFALLTQCSTTEPQANICVHSVGVLSGFCKIHDIVKLHIVKTTLTILSQTIYIAPPLPHTPHTHTTHELNYALLPMQPHMYTSSHITMKTIHIQYLQLCTTHPLKPHTHTHGCGAYRCFLHSVSLWSLKMKDLVHVGNKVLLTRRGFVF